jgi:hypothetical protein
MSYPLPISKNGRISSKKNMISKNYLKSKITTIESHPIISETSSINNPSGVPAIAQPIPIPKTSIYFHQSTNISETPLGTLNNDIINETIPNCTIHQNHVLLEVKLKKFTFSKLLKILKEENIKNYEFESGKN